MYILTFQLRKYILNAQGVLQVNSCVSLFPMLLFHEQTGKQRQIMSRWRFLAPWCRWQRVPALPDCGSATRMTRRWPESHFCIAAPLLGRSWPSLFIWAHCETLTYPKTYRIPLFSLIWGCHTWFKQSCHGVAGVPPPCAHTGKHTHTSHQPPHLETLCFPPMKTSKFWCEHLFPFHLANKMFYATANLAA